MAAWTVSPGPKGNLAVQDHVALLVWDPTEFRGLRGLEDFWVNLGKRVHTVTSV